MKKKEAGAASLRIELKNGTISIYHGTDGALLAVLKNAPSGTWLTMWNKLLAIGFKQS